MMPQDLLIHLEQVSILNLIQLSCVRVVDQLDRPWAEARGDCRPLVFGFVQVAFSLTVASQDVEAPFDVSKTLINVRIWSSLTQAWIIMLLEDSFKSVNGILQLFDDLEKIECCQTIRVVDQLSELREA
jgi:hypothetical protein